MHARVIALVPVAEQASAAGAEASSALVSSVLQQVARELEILAGEPTHLQVIDLHSLPLDEPTTAALRAALGQGEVAIRIRCAALTLVEETSYPGVWWQSQGASDSERDGLLGQGRLDQIVVAAVPPLVGAPREDVAEAAARLHAAAPAFMAPKEPPSTGDAHD